MAKSKAPILLLVEDDELLTHVLEDGLTSEGFAVVLANSGQEGLSQLNTDGKRFKCVITDIRLGEGPNGWEIGHRAREIMSGIPVIYMSGDSAGDWSANGVPNSVMMQKPFVIAQLVTAVSTLLNDAAAQKAMVDASKSSE